MKCLNFYTKLDSMHNKDYIETYLVYTLSLVIAGIKPSATVTIKKNNEKYHCPHELGLFLGIPFEDVKDFMECTTKKCLLCGYWKVYNNTNEATRIFNKYDKG